MKLADILEGRALLKSGSLDVEIAGLTADSRAVQPGFLFAGLPGPRDFLPGRVLGFPFAGPGFGL